MLAALYYVNPLFNLLYFQTIARMRRRDGDTRVILDADHCINIL